MSSGWEASGQRYFTIPVCASCRCSATKSRACWQNYGPRRFYGNIASVVGLQVLHDSPERLQLSDGAGSFTFVPGDRPTENVHLAFGVGNLDAVVRFHEVATAAGYADNGPPGERPQYHPGYYGAFVLDADGHNVEAVFHDRTT